MTIKDMKAEAIPKIKRCAALPDDGSNNVSIYRIVSQLSVRFLISKFRHIYRRWALLYVVIISPGIQPFFNNVIQGAELYLRSDVFAQ